MTHDTLQGPHAARARAGARRDRFAGPAIAAAAVALLSADHAGAACDAARAVDLELDGDDAALRRAVAEELRSGNLGVCDTPGSGVLAKLFIRTPAPERPIASIRVSRAEAQPLERELDVSAFPAQARALAIATAADELVRAALAGPVTPEPATGSAPLAAERAASPLDRAVQEKAAPSGAALPERRARVEVGWRPRRRACSDNAKPWAPT